MYIGVGSVMVSTTIDVHGDSLITYLADPVTGNVILTFGSDDDACLCLTGRGADRLADVLDRARTDLRAPDPDIDDR